MKKEGEFMLKNVLKNAVRKAIVHRRKRRLFSSIMKSSKALVKSHPEWKALTETEKALMTDKDYWRYVAFRNVRGVLEYGHVSDAFYQAYMLPLFNPMNYTGLFRSTRTYNIFCNKNYFSLMLNYLPTPETVIMRVNGILMNRDYEILTEEAALDEMNQHERLVFKPAKGGYHGKSVSLVERKNFREALTDYANSAIGGGGLIVQTLLKQHESFSRFNSSSVNVIRITTLFWKKEVYVLGGILRVGAPGEFCDLTTSPDNNHPRVIALDDNGRLTGKFIDPDLAYVYDDCYGVKPSGFIPKYEQMKELVVKEHSRFPYQGIIGWDITLDENENIICIEYNTGVPGIIQSQYCLGPIFAQKSSRGKPLIDEILSEI